jgi:membrane protease YdiL (CAAX protease family)
MRGYGDLVARHALPAQYLPRSRMRLRSDPIFSGRIGAGLRVLLFVVAVALTLVAFDPPLTGAIARWTGVAAAGPRGELLAGVVALRWVDVLLVLAVTRAFAALERRDMGAYGLPWRTGALMEVVTGMIVGTAAVAAVLGALGLADALTLGPVALGAASTFVSGAAWAVALLAVAALEEMLFRGYLLATLGRSIGFWPAAVLLSLAFVAAHGHNPGETPAGLTAVFLFAILFSAIVRWRGSIWLPVGIHAGWDWAQSFLFGVPDSGTVAQGRLFAPRFSGLGWLTGGTAGPEGSALTLALLVVAFAMVVRVGATRGGLSEATIRSPG